MISSPDKSVVHQIVRPASTCLHRKWSQWLLILSVICLSCSVVDSSLGDSLSYFRDCCIDCSIVNCSTPEKVAEFHRHQHLFDWLFGWTCQEDCQYECQWATINYLSLDSGHLFYQRIPQFYGKWTFRRLLGAQEPAAALFSIFNLCSTLIAWRRFRSSIRSADSDVAGDPLVLVTDVSAILATHAWFWSTVFHVHDYPLTEKLDYFSASSVVLFNLYSILIRLVDYLLPATEPIDARSSVTDSSPSLHPSLSSSSFRFIGSNRKALFLAIGAVFLAFYYQHVRYMALEYFDYGYNMKVNIAVGVSGSGLWLLWAFVRMQREEDPQSVAHVKTGILCVIFLNVCLSLEIMDFPPILSSSLDSHTLWHLATSPIPFFWFRFLAQETIALRNKKLLLRDDG